MLYLAKGSFWVGASQATNSLLSLGLIIAFANLLPKETYGTYRYILSIAGILNIFTLSGMNIAVARAVAVGEDGVLKPAVTYQLKWNLLMLIASFILGSYYFLQGDTTLAISLFILGFFVPCTLAFNTYGSYLEGKKKFGVSNILSIISTFIYSTGLLFTLFLTDEIVWLVAAYAITTFIPSLIFYVYVIRKYKPPITKDAFDTFKYGRELTYLRLIDPVVGQIDKIILGHFWGPAQLATYSLALAVPSRAILLIKSWVAIGFPKFSEKTVHEINKVFARRIIQGMLVGLFVAFVYILAAPHLFKYLLPQYLDSIFYSQLLAIGFVFALPNRYISLLFTSQKLSKVLFNRTIIMSSISILLYIVFGIFGGLLGLILANILCSLIGLSINISMWLKIVNQETNYSLSRDLTN